MDAFHTFHYKFFFVLDKDGAELSSVYTPVETVMGNNSLLSELVYFTTESIEGVFFSLAFGFLFGSSLWSHNNLFWILYLLPQIPGIAV